MLGLTVPVAVIADLRYRDRRGGLAIGKRDLQALLETLRRVLRIRVLRSLEPHELTQPGRGLLRHGLRVGRKRPVSLELVICVALDPGLGLARSRDGDLLEVRLCHPIEPAIWQAGTCILEGLYELTVQQIDPP